MSTQRIIIVVGLLIAAFVVVRLLARRARPDSLPEDPNAFMPMLADAAAKFAAGRGMSLDYSPGSVEHVESLLAELHQSRAAGRLADRDLHLHAHQFGAYVGEVLRRTYGGHWAEDHELAGPKSFPLHWKDGQSFPVGWCGKRILNGDEDNVWAKFQIVTSEEYLRLRGAMTQASDAGPAEE